MKLKQKSWIISFISIMLIILNIFIMISYGFKIPRFLFIVISILILVLAKNKKNLYPLAALFSVLGILESHPGMLIITGCGMFSSFMKSDEEMDLKTFIKKNTLFASIIIGICGISLISYGALINYCSRYSYGPEMVSELAACLCLGVLIFICRKYRWIIKNEVTFFEMIKISLPIWIFLAISATVQICSNIYTHPLQPAAYIIILILDYLLVGLFEEFLLRGIVLNLLLDKYKTNKRSIWFAIIVSSLLFGLAHFMNLSTGASLSGVSFQVISATAMGIYLAAIYLRTGNIWYNSLIHGLWDVCASISFIFVGNEMEYGEVLSSYSAVILIPAIFYLIFALFLLRKKKMNGVIAKLNNKEYVEKTNETILAIQRVFSGIIVFFACITVVALIYDFKKIDENVTSSFNSLPKYYDSDNKYLFTDDFDDEDLTMEIKLFIATSTLDIDTDRKDFVIKDEDLSKAYKKIFKKDLAKEDYIEFEFSRNQICTHEEKEYQCTYTSEYEDRNIKVYSGIKDYSTDGSEVKVEIYYLLEDLDTNKIYGDSSLENQIYTGSITTLTKKEFKDDPYNPEFFDEVSKKIDIPTYEIKYEVSSTLDGLTFKEVDSCTDELEIDIKYDKKTFKRKDYHNKTILKADDNNFVEIKSLSQSTYMDKLLGSIILYIGNNKYYYNSSENIYLINDKDSYYSIKLIITDYSIQEKGIEILRKFHL